MGKCVLHLMIHLSSLCGLRWLTREKWLMRMFACCLFEGMVSVVVMVACDCVMLLLESVMLFKDLYSLLVFVL